jgi:pectate lyase
MKKLFLAFCIILPIEIGIPFYISAQTKAFPTAEGFGCMASGGRGGQVVEVTTLKDSISPLIPGSLRWALKQYEGQPITVVFRVSGIINLKGGTSGELRCKRNNWTLAGQTAPGDGICIMGNKVNFGGSTNLIIRHLRFRIGTMVDPVTGLPDASGNGSIGIENASNWIIDHCTFGWSGEENMTIYDNINTTIQWSIIHEGLYQSGHNKGNRGYGSQWGGQNATFHHNLLAHNYNRSPRFNGARSNDMNVLIDYVNNVNYNWGKANSCYGSDIENISNRTNFVNNYYKPGPARPGTSSSYFSQSSVSGSQGYQVAQWYASGNYIEGTANMGKNANNYLGIDMSAYSATVKADSSLWISPTPFAITYPVTTETAAQAYESVLAGAGAFPRDTVDRRIVYEVRTGTATGDGVFGTNKGIIDSPDAVGGYPVYNTYNTITDNDHDGMDDAWEIANGLNPADASDRNLYVEAGYTVLEVYLNSLAGETIPMNIVSAVETLKKTNNFGFSIEENTLYFIRNTQQVTNVKIFNLSGQNVLTKTAKGITCIDFSNLGAGIYLAEIRFADDNVRNLKLIKR